MCGETEGVLVLPRAGTGKQAEKGWESLLMGFLSRQ